METMVCLDGGKRTVKNIICEQCKKEFTYPECWSNKRRFCSNVCYRINISGKKVKTNCAWCNKEIIRLRSKVRSKSKLIFCNRKCKESGQKIGLNQIKEIQPMFYGTGKQDYRKIAFRNNEKICSKCGYSDARAIVIHHKDRNRENNNLENLEVLCANCHLIEHSHKTQR